MNRKQRNTNDKREEIMPKTIKVPSPLVESQTVALMLSPRELSLLKQMICIPDIAKKQLRTNKPKYELYKKIMQTRKGVNNG